MAVLESREVADAKSDYLAARLSNDLQQDLTARDKSLWEGRAVPEQQYIRSRNAAAQTVMRFGIARQKLLALGVRDDEITTLPQAPDASLRSQNVRAPISGRIAERKVELGTAVGRDNLETELFVLVDLGRVWVELSVSSPDLPMVREGQAVAVTLRGFPDATTGKIMFVSPCSTRRPAPRELSWSSTTPTAAGAPDRSSRRRSRSTSIKPRWSRRSARSRL
ncbi:efflux RND transporter periplasmic adaptor subunit [Bradyrhizobium sp. 169]|uniref:efflux RND transporter periplasmic adaptor subunit n=1 Tax=Bradyrhizobium sp. 169 TaxID=2782640 RepID=UPI001FF9259C|nr:efflux RND transporter periplasmic adaptor subunit [Bradyrhizobium sp. 169]